MKHTIAALLAICTIGCQSPQKSQTAADQGDSVNQEVNPPAPGFDQENSDQKAIEIADQVMNAMGGRENWDQTRVICWNFFGRRSLVWDKWSGDVRIEIPGQKLTILENVNSKQGKVQKEGREVTHPDSLAQYLDRGLSIWINDSYWLLMPFKLKDSGVTLKYLGEDQTQSGQKVDVLELTFEGVGRTPDNRYKVCVDRASKLVCQWEFFRHYEDDSSAFVNPWANYEKHGNIMLSGNRGDREITDIMVRDSVPPSVFNSFDPVNLSQL